MVTVRRFADQYEEFRKRKVELVQVFHSPVEALADFVHGDHAVPFPVLGDPAKRAYAAWGVGGGLLSLLRPSAWKRSRAAARQGHKPRWRDMLRDGIGVAPADFLIGPGGRLERVHYGRDFTDSLQPDAVLADWLG